MKKDRNAFFQEASYFSGTNIPNPNMNVANTPFATQSASSFYAGPVAPMNYNIPNNLNTNISNVPNYDFSDIESRLSKLERQVNRLDARVSKLETNTYYPTEEIDTTTNMYMV
mgnify:FL=1